MRNLVVTLIGILRLRSGPQDLPVGWSIAGALILLYTAANIYTQNRLGDPNAELRSLLTIVVQVVAVGALLTLRGFPARFAQTLGALAGTGFVLGMLSYAVVSQADPERQQPVLALLLLGLFVWSLVVDGHIYRNALAISMSRGVLIAVLLFAVSFSLIELAVI